MTHTQHKGMMCMCARVCSVWMIIMFDNLKIIFSLSFQNPNNCSLIIGIIRTFLILSLFIGYFFV